MLARPNLVLTTLALGALAAGCSSAPVRHSYGACNGEGEVRVGPRGQLCRTTLSVQATVKPENQEQDDTHVEY